MSGVSEVAYSLAGAGNAASKQSKKRKKRASAAAKAKAKGEWQTVDMEDMQLEGFQDGCAFELEELTDYHLQTTADGGHMLVGAQQKPLDDKPAKKKRRKGKQQQADSVNDDATTDTTPHDAPQSATPEPEEHVSAEQREEAPRKKKKKRRGGKKTAPAESVDTVALADVRLPKWDAYKLHPLLLQSLHMSGFLAPTRIQERTLLPALLDNRDVVGAAPTGSGKTLAFGLPILSQLLYEREQRGYVKECKALVLTPTRELALQIHQHLEKMVRHREIGVATLVGGMAVQKQKRLLGYRPEVVIGTPGRLWDLMESNHAHLSGLAASLRFLVVDEADRMLQPGSYPEVEKIFEVLRHKGQSAASELAKLSDDEEEEDEEEEEEDGEDGEDIDANQFANGAQVMMLDDVLKMQQKQEAADEKSPEDVATTTSGTQEAPVAARARRHTRQTFLFSATLTIPEGGRFQKHNKKKTHRNALTVLESVMKRVGLRGKPAVVDLSVDESVAGQPQSERKRKQQQENVALSLPAGLELCQHEVTDDTRDSFLYYFLTQYPGRTIVFLNAIHQVRKLTSLLSLLQLPVFALHAEMQQRQRLKKLDGFRAHEHGILVATDVAARGLDIPSVDYVVHYHIARSTEVFVHRSGRTARADKDGLSISLVSPVDATNHAQICKMLQRPTGLSDFPFDHRYLPAVDERMRLAQSINEQENASGKLKSEETWFAQMAAAADLELDDDLLFELGAKKRNQGLGKKKAQGADTSAEALRAQLARLLTAPLRPVGSVRKFRQLYQELGTQLAPDGEYRARDASADLASKGKKAYKRFRRRK